MHQKLARIQISHQELLRKMLIFSQIFFILVLKIQFIKLNFHQFLILKIANINPVFKKGDSNSKENYRPVSILSNIWKIFERCMFRQIPDFMDFYLAKQQCGFTKGCSRQCYLLVMLEKWKNGVDKQKML